MAQSTEAACLLQSGSTYPRRLGLRTGSGEDVFFGVRQGGFSLYFGDAPIYHFDFEGRWQRAFVAGLHYLKGLDATVHALSREREGGGMVLRRRCLPEPGTRDLDAAIRSAALDLIDGLAAGKLDVLPPPSEAQVIPPGQFQDYLERVATWDAAAWHDQRASYLATYRPWPLLPPDSPNPVVLQATSGHPAGRTFGGARATGYHVRSPEEFEGHARAVARLYGRRLGQCRDVFLAGADVLHQPLDQIHSYLGTIQDHFPDLLHPPLPGDPGARRPGLVHAFVDDFRLPLPGLDDWRGLRSALLGRVTLGIESGDESIRAGFGKSWGDEALRRTAADLKAAGIGVGVIALVGPGGPEEADAHVEATAALIGSLGLGPGDLVTMIDVQCLDGQAEYRADDVAAEFAALKRRLAELGATKGPRVVAYNPAKQWT